MYEGKLLSLDLTLCGINWSFVDGTKVVRYKFIRAAITSACKYMYALVLELFTCIKKLVLQYYGDDEGDANFTTLIVNEEE